MADLDGLILLPWPQLAVISVDKGLSLEAGHSFNLEHKSCAHIYDP